MRHSIRLLKIAVKKAAKVPYIPPQRMKRKTFETILIIGIDAAEFGEGAEHLSSEFGSELRALLKASQEGRTIEIED